MSIDNGFSEHCALTLLDDSPSLTILTLGTPRIAKVAVTARAVIVAHCVWTVHVAGYQNHPRSIRTSPMMTNLVPFLWYLKRMIETRANRCLVQLLLRL